MGPDTLLREAATPAASAGRRRFPIGAEALPEGGVDFRVWAPRCRELTVEIENLRAVPLSAEAGGYFSTYVDEARPGMRYRLRPDHGDQAYPDPASHFQPDGPHGPSEIIDPRLFQWSDTGWRGRRRDELAIYEMHIGTFAPEGTWQAAQRELPALAELGITCLELMPVADFPGGFGWGYDGVDLFAPTRLYGRPDDFRAFVDRAHALGLAVILDVVYNHLGPDGNYLKCFSESYFTDRYKNEWGEAVNFDGPDSGPVREFVLANVRYWIEEFHLDGLRLDATQQMFDASREHILAAITREVRNAAPGRNTIVIGENEPQETRLVRPSERGGYGLDALWNDDFHHSAMVALTGRREAYYTDYRGRPNEFIAAAKYGFLYQGQRYVWQKKPRGTPALDLPAESFVVFLQNHDQVANSIAGQRLHALTSPGRWRAMTAHLLLMPGIPMLFQGQDFAASNPFLYFADHRPGLDRAVRRGRREFLGQFPSMAAPEVGERLADPSDAESFRRSTLDPAERQTHAGAAALHRDLLALRRDDPALGLHATRVDGAVLGACAWLLRFFSDEGDRLLIINLGPDLTMRPAPEPLLAPIEGHSWGILWSSEAPEYGGVGTPPLYRRGYLRIAAESALVLIPAKRDRDNRKDRRQRDG
jgi:maltooligosyltrehalose trehalohydrolase